MSQPELEINVDETFEHLPNAPIVEAVIRWQAQPAQKLDPGKFLDDLLERLPDYPNATPQHQLSINHLMGPDESSVRQSHSWDAFQFSAEDNHSVALFGRNGLVVSRLPPYRRWSDFRDEALRLWTIYRDLAEPPEIQAIGVRYINLVSINSVEEASRLLAEPPAFPGTLGLPVNQYTHQSRFEIPSKDYALNLVQTIQPAPPNADHQLHLIVDLDIRTTSPKVDHDNELQTQILAEMRWLKNKAFFSIFSTAAIQLFASQPSQG